MRIDYLFFSQHQLNVTNGSYGILQFSESPFEKWRLGFTKSFTLGRTKAPLKIGMNAFPELFAGGVLWKVGIEITSRHQLKRFLADFFFKSRSFFFDGFGFLDEFLKSTSHLHLSGKVGFIQFTILWQIAIVASIEGAVFRKNLGSFRPGDAF